MNEISDILLPKSSIVFVIFWNILYNLFGIIMTDRNISKNFNHLVHALMFIVIKYLEFNKLLCLLTMSFYLHDIFLICYDVIQKYTSLKSNLLYLVHHLVAVYTMNLVYNNFLVDFILGCFNCAEISNIAIYIYYYCYKKKCLKNLDILLVIEFLWYTYWRVIYFFNYLLEYKHELIIQNVYSQSLLGIFIFMNIYWSFKLFVFIYNKMLKDKTT
jgi:hypothetical protein